MPRFNVASSTLEQIAFEDIVKLFDKDRCLTPMEWFFFPRGLKAYVYNKDVEEDVEDFFYPARGFFDRDQYRFEVPHPQKYAIGLIVDPCRGNAFDCCMGRFGSPVYAAGVAPRYLERTSILLIFVRGDFSRPSLDARRGKSCWIVSFCLDVTPPF